MRLDKHPDNGCKKFNGFMQEEGCTTLDVSVIIGFILRGLHMILSFFCHFIWQYVGCQQWCEWSQVYEAPYV